MTYRARNIVLAVALAVVAALLTGFYVTNYKRTVQHGERQVSVYVAAKDIPAGTTGADVASGGYLKKVDVPRRSVVPGAISQPDQVARYVAKDQVNAGEQVSTRRFTTRENSGPRAQLKGPLRAVQVAGNPNQLLAGTLRAGDRVDLIGNFRVPEGGSVHFSRTVLRDLRVLKAPNGPLANDKIGGSASQLSVMLAVTDTQADKLWWVVNNSDGTANGWSLALRATVDSSDSPEATEWYRTMIFDGLNRYQLRRAGKGGAR